MSRSADKPTLPGRSAFAGIAATAWIATLFLTGLLAGCAGSPAGGRDRDAPFFEADVITGLGDEEQPRATVTVSIPYRRLVFFQREDGFVSEYRLRAVQRVGERALRLREWTGTVFAADFEETRQPKVVRRTVGLDLVEGGLGPGARLDLVVEVDGTERRGRTSLALDGARPRRGGLTLGDPSLYRQRDHFADLPTDVEVMQRAMPDPTLFSKHRRGSFDLSTGRPWIYVRVFDLRSGVNDSTYHITLRVLGEEAGDPRWSTTIDVPRVGSDSAVLLRVPSGALRFGANRVRLSLAGTEGVEVEIESRGLDFEDDRSWESNLELVEIIASSSEMQQLEIASRDEREARWRAFWDQRDPDPGTEINEALLRHRERVAYARANLRDGFRDGALSDRGRIWVLHGPPDSIETAGDGFDASDSYEVWRYESRGLIYTFRDIDGFGSYRLVWREPFSR